MVNLIPYNQTDVKDKLRCPSEAHMRKFQEIVTSYKTFCTTRRTMGADIASACGQLVVKKEQEDTKNMRDVDIEDAANNPVTGSSTPKNAKVKKPTTTASRNMDVSETRNATDNLDRLIKPLAIATTIAATAFVVSVALFLRRRKV